MAQKPPRGPDAFTVTNEALSSKAEIDLTDFYTRLSNRAAELITNYRQQGLAGQVLADKVIADLQDLSDQPILDMGRSATSEAFNLGRNLAAQTSPVPIGEVVRTAILDKNTCDPCTNLDGKVETLNTPSYFENMPPNYCDGEDLCRCFYLYRSAA